MALRRNLLDRGRVGPQCIATFKHGFEVLLDWQQSAVVGLELEAMQIDGRTTSASGVTLIEFPDFGQLFIGAITLGR